MKPSRRTACAIAKVNPAVTFFDGDPAAFIISENVNRRHLTKSQRAMAVAEAFPEPARGRGNKDAAKGIGTISFGLINHARTIRRLAPDLVGLVLAGSMTVDDAYKKASLRKSEAERLSDRVRSVSRENPELAERRA